MFWVTAVTLVAILVYIYLALRLEADINSGEGRNRNYIALKGLGSIKIVDLPRQTVTSVKVPRELSHDAKSASAKEDLQVVGVVVSPAHAP
jgi:hypothetical protein